MQSRTFATLQSDPRVKLLGIQDFSSIAALYRHLNPEDPPLVPDAHTARVWEGIVNSPDNFVLGYEEDNFFVSCCSLTMIPNLSRSVRPYGLIENVVTLPEYRRRGIASKLLQRGLALAWENDCYKVMLMTGSRKESTLEFYKKCGFEMGKKTGFVAYP